MNKVVHFEIPFEDEERAKKFYQNVFGWQILKAPDMDYNMVTTVETDQQTMMPKTPGAINGGLMKKDQTGTHPVIVIDVPDVDGHLKQIEEAGGKVIMPKIPVGEIGLYARVADTEGNIIGIWQNRPRQ
ncbi:MAG: VOC family protein [Nitrososphaera sp.]|nr:VOC family protein [Nitrososphaera sp.]